MQVYEEDSSKAQYLEFHYADSKYFGVENFPRKCAEHCVQACNENGVTLGRAIDLGCAVGRSTFELAKLGFGEVYGTDLSQNFIETAKAFHELGSLKYALVDEGDLKEIKTVDLETLNLKTVADKVHFFQSDASKIDIVKYNNFDLVFAGNLICRMQKPRDFLRNLHNLVKPGGLFIATTPCTWLTDFTHKNEWVGGYERDGKRITTHEGMKEILSENFEEVKERHEVEFVIKETKRKFQHSSATMSYWKRKNVNT